MHARSGRGGSNAPGHEGRWYRRGDSIVLIPGHGVPDAAEVFESPGGGIPSARDLMDPRIDVHAQYALRRMFKSDSVARADAMGMFAAVKARDLAGIYIVNQAVPALRARRMNRWWWELIPKGQDAILMSDPPTEPPLIAFRDEIKTVPSRLDSALRGAWREMKSRTIGIPLCKKAQRDLDRLKRSVDALNRELKRVPPRADKVQELEESVKGSIDFIVLNIDSYIPDGCCKPHLKVLEAEVSSLPWPSSFEAAKSFLLGLIRTAQETADKDFKNC
jgi:hypothetical protein